MREHAINEGKIGLALTAGKDSGVGTVKDRQRVHMPLAAWRMLVSSQVVAYASKELLGQDRTLQRPPEIVQALPVAG